MATTKQIVKEKIQRIYQRYLDQEDINDSIEAPEVELLVEQEINAVLKPEIKERSINGYIDIPRCNIIKYASQAVTADAPNSRAYVDLPAIPISLPKDMGIWRISDTAGPNTPYIPLHSQSNIVMQGTNVAVLEQQIGYFLEGKRVYFTKDITTVANGSVSNVDIFLLVSDLAQLAETDLLPLSPEYEKVVVTSVLIQMGMGKEAINELSARDENNNI